MRERRRKRVVTVLLAAVVLVLAGCGGKPSGPAEEEAGPQRPVEIETAVAKLQDLNPTVELVGTLMAEPEKTVELSSQAAGLVDKVLVTEGQQVAAGAELVHLDDRTARAALDKARAARDEAAANLALLKRGPLAAEIESARQDVKKAAQTAEALSAKLAALKPLREAGEISKVKHDETQAAFQAAQADREMAAARLSILKAGTRPETMAQAEAHLKAADADAAAQELAVDLCAITSPISGALAELPVRQGMYVQPGTLVAKIVDLSVLLARFKLPSAELGLVAAGSRVTVRLTGLNDAALEGTVARLGAEADPQSADVEAFATVDNAADTLRPNLACRVEVALPAALNTLAVPTSAVSDRDGTPVVTVIRDGQAHEVPVKTGIRTETMTQVVEGVSPGDVVATKGGYGLPEGCPVKPVTAQ